MTLFKDIHIATWFKIKDSDVKRLKIEAVKWAENDVRNSVHKDPDGYMNYVFFPDDQEVIPIQSNWEIMNGFLEMGKS